MNRKPSPVDRAVLAQCDALGALYEAKAAIQIAEERIRQANREIDDPRRTAA